ncbi:LuxR family transcriptional regulator [Kitasatospora sp. NBC_01560]|uniref:LuxR family transcriptional regulator n=1 Tax=Kitasatospora sp. NBC_01560 TaxID=2975965 RepID=UPI0038661F1E
MTDECRPAERALYLAALAEGGRIATAALGPDDAPALAGLLEHGLLAPAADGYAAVDPRSAGDRLGAELRSEATRLLVRAERLPAALDDLTRAYDEARRPSGTTGEATRTLGREAIRQRISDLLAGCQDELLAARPGPRREATMELALRQDLPLLRSGRRIRTLYQPEARRRPAVIAYAGTVTRHGAQIRVLDEPFDRMIVVDREVAIVSAAEDHGAAAFITDRATVAQLVAVFERDWARAEVTDWSATAPHPTTLRVGQLLRQGLTQRTIAGRLHLSERSVAAHIARLRGRHGAQTLFQLGWQMRGGGDG